MTYPLQRFGGRKFVATLVAVSSATSLAALGKIDPGVYSVVMVATVGAYIAGNVVQKKIEGNGND